uniref:Uncharacterized protein n=1 Tax=Rhodnius prolixus TaxID=13249 RepID=T1IEW9_RHOPR
MALLRILKTFSTFVACCPILSEFRIKFLNKKTLDQPVFVSYLDGKDWADQSGPQKITSAPDAPDLKTKLIRNSLNNLHPFALNQVTRPYSPEDSNQEILSTNLKSNVYNNKYKQWQGAWNKDQSCNRWFYGSYAGAFEQS